MPSRSPDSPAETPAVGLDDLDRRLIALLRSDARLPSAALARQLGVSRGTVQNRIDRLAAAGVLLGFTVRLAGRVGAAVRAIMTIEVRSADTRAVVAALRRMPGVGRVHSTNGRWDLVAEIEAPDLAGLDRVLTAVRALKPVAGSETSILLSELK